MFDNLPRVSNSGLETKGQGGFTLSQRQEGQTKLQF